MACFTIQPLERSRELAMRIYMRVHVTALWSPLPRFNLNPFYHPFYPDITHMRKDTRPSPAFAYCKRQKAGRGLGTRLEFIYCKPQGVLTSTNQGRYTASYKFQLGQLEGSEAMCSTSYVHYRIARLDIHSAVTQLDASAGPRLPIE